MNSMNHQPVTIFSTIDIGGGPGCVADQLHHIQQIKSSSDAFVALRDDAKLICGETARRRRLGVFRIVGENNGSRAVGKSWGNQWKTEKTQGVF